MHRLKYHVYDKATDALIVEGTAEECAVALGIREDSLREKYYKQGRRSRYKITRSHICDEKAMTKDHESLIKKWDDFVTPIREAYGVPQWCGVKGGA